MPGLLIEGTTVTATLSGALPAGSNVIGNVGIDQTTPGTTNAVQLAAAIPAGTALIGKTGIDQTTPGTTNAVAPISGQAGVAGGSGVVGATTQRVVLATDVGLPAGTAAIGKTNLNPGAAALTSVKIDTASSGDLTLVAATSSMSTKLYRFLLVAAGATTITFKDGATTLTGAMTLAAGGSLTLDFDGEPWFTGTANTAFIVNNSAAVQISGRAYYILS